MMLWEPKTKPNDPVFPESETVNNIGLTIREHFAAMVMQGLITDENYSDTNYPVNTARIAVKFADALIEALNEKGETHK